MAKYTKGWLCRKSDWVSDDLTFFPMSPKEPELCDTQITFVWRVLPIQEWMVQEFDDKYDYNFKLPEHGEKVECWIEL